MVSKGYCSHCHSPLMIWSCAFPLETTRKNKCRKHEWLQVDLNFNTPFIASPCSNSSDWCNAIICCVISHAITQLVLIFPQITGGLPLNSIRRSHTQRSLYLHSALPESLGWQLASDLRGATHAYPFINGWLGGGDPDCWRWVSRPVQFHLSKREIEQKVDWLWMVRVSYLGCHLKLQPIYSKSTSRPLSLKFLIFNCFPNVFKTKT